MAKFARTPVVDRKRQLDRIHPAKKRLNLGDDTYRALLACVTGKTSSADMTTAERNAVIAEIARLSFKVDEQEGRKR